MRFRAPRSLSPSPVRKQSPRKRLAFGITSDSEDESDSASVSGSIASTSSDSIEYDIQPRSTQFQPRPRRRPGRSIQEQEFIEETMASIRRRVHHTDVYEEWESNTRKEAFVSAKREHLLRKSQRRQQQQAAHSQDASRLAALHTQQMEEVQEQLASFRLAQQNEEKRLHAEWQVRDRILWERIENVIQIEEAKVRAKLEVERKKREEEEKARLEAQERQRQEEERKRLEAERIKAAAEERQRQEEERNRVNAQIAAEEKERKSLGVTTPEQDWQRGRMTLQQLKQAPMRVVKGNKELKSIWSAGRRAITPKIGQLTNDLQAIQRISQEIVNIVRPTPPHPPPVYLALLSSLSKAILLQAETEVTAEKRSAFPLAHVASNLLWALDGFAGIFWAKLLQRTGGWPVPFIVPATDANGMILDGPKRRKALGFINDEESLADYSARVSGIMRVYFHILFIPTPQPLDPLFSQSKYWTYFTRMLSQNALLHNSVAPQILHAALEVGGADALKIWGRQWVKLLAILYDGATVSLPGSTPEKKSLVGGGTPEGTAARTRVQLEIERIMGTVIG